MKQIGEIGNKRCHNFIVSQIISSFMYLDLQAIGENNYKSLIYLMIVVSNQPGVAKGKCSVTFLETLTQQITIDLKGIGAWLDGIYYCLHHPDGSVLEYRMDCDCRKPKSGLLIKASQEHNIDLSSSYMIGDRFIDIQAGQAAGCKSIFVESPATNRYNLSEYIDSYPNLPQAVRRIWQDERVP